MSDAQTSGLPAGDAGMAGSAAGSEGRATQTPPKHLIEGLENIGNMGYRL